MEMMCEKSRDYVTCILLMNDRPAERWRSERKKSGLLRSLFVVEIRGNSSKVTESQPLGNAQSCKVLREDNETVEMKCPLREFIFVCSALRRSDGSAKQIYQHFSADIGRISKSRCLCLGRLRVTSSKWTSWRSIYWFQVVVNRWHRPKMYSIPMAIDRSVFVTTCPISLLPNSLYSSDCLILFNHCLKMATLGQWIRSNLQSSAKDHQSGSFVDWVRERLQFLSCGLRLLLSANQSSNRVKLILTHRSCPCH